MRVQLLLASCAAIPLVSAFTTTTAALGGGNVSFTTKRNSGCVPTQPQYGNNISYSRMYTPRALKNALKVCSGNSACAGVMDTGCDKRGPFYLCMNAKHGPTSNLSTGTKYLALGATCGGGRGGIRTPCTPGSSCQGKALAYDGPGKCVSTSKTGVRAGQPCKKQYYGGKVTFTAKCAVGLSCSLMMGIEPPKGMMVTSTCHSRGGPYPPMAPPQAPPMMVRGRRLQRTQKNTVTYKSGSCLYRSTYHPVKPPIRVDPPPMRLPPQQQVVYG